MRQKIELPQTSLQFVTSDFEGARKFVDVEVAWILRPHGTCDPRIGNEQFRGEQVGFVLQLVSFPGSCAQMRLRAVQDVVSDLVSQTPPPARAGDSLAADQSSASARGSAERVPGVRR